MKKSITKLVSNLPKSLYKLYRKSKIDFWLLTCFVVIVIGDLLFSGYIINFVFWLYFTFWFILWLRFKFRVEVIYTAAIVGLCLIPLVLLLDLKVLAEKLSTWALFLFFFGTAILLVRKEYWLGYKYFMYVINGLQDQTTLYIWKNTIHLLGVDQYRLVDLCKQYVSVINSVGNPMTSSQPVFLLITKYMLFLLDWIFLPLSALITIFLTLLSSYILFKKYRYWNTKK